MKKYEIIKNAKDNYTLKYKDQTYDFKTDISLIRDMQGATKNSRVKMIKDLAKDGISIKDLSIEEKKDGKTYIDNSNKAELEKIYYEEAMVEVMNEIVKRQFGKTYEELLLDIGFTEEDEKEMEQFSIDFVSALTGTTPSGK